MGKNKHSGGGPGMSKMPNPIKGIRNIARRMSDRQEPEDPYHQRGDSDEERDDDEEMRGIPRVLPIIPVSEYQIPSDFKRYRGAIDHYWSGRKLLIDRGKCYEYVYVDRMSQDENTAWATMRPNYVGEYDPSTGETYIRLGHVMTLLRFNVVENGIEYTNLVEAPANSFRRDVKDAWFREVPCKPIEIPSLQRVAYNKVSDADKQLLHDTLNFPVPRRGGNAVKRNKKSGRKTRRKSRRNTKRKSRRNKL
jgi:hypothetical protein